MLRLLTPEVVAKAAQTQIQTGERVCLNWSLEKLHPPGTLEIQHATGEKDEEKGD